MGMRLCLAGSFFPVASPGKEALSIVRTPVARHPGQHPKLHKKWSYASPEEEEEKGALEVKKCALAAKLLLFSFSFFGEVGGIGVLGGFFERQQLIFF